MIAGGYIATGCKFFWGDAFSTERRIPSGCKHYVFRQHEILGLTCHSPLIPRPSIHRTDDTGVAFAAAQFVDGFEGGSRGFYAGNFESRV